MSKFADVIKIVIIVDETIMVTLTYLTVYFDHSKNPFQFAFGE